VPASRWPGPDLRHKPRFEALLILSGVR
jgi:hypothetical protein